MHESRQQCAQGSAAAAATVRGRPGAPMRRAGDRCARATVTRNLHAMPRIAMHRNDAIVLPAAAPI
ncbi:hypothetical protein WS89_18725 [Burkholderia sp. MSMB1072]|nr:hypothetical protein WS89_18725 [Burkholderia sp. MSMB1072]